MINHKTVVYTAGSFDLIHKNHFKIIEYAKSLGDILIVGVNSDELIKENKGHKPIMSLDDRMYIVKNIKGVDLCIPQYSLDHKDKVKNLKFDIFVVGDDWTGKYDYLQDYGVSVVYTPYGRSTSSTELRNRIAKEYGKTGIDE